MTDRLGGRVCSLTYDTSRDVDAGDVLVTRAGSAYLVISVRPMRSKYPGRLRLSCTRIDPSTVSEDDVVHPLYWYPRRRRS